MTQLVGDSRSPASLARFWATALDGFERYDDKEIARLRPRGTRQRRIRALGGSIISARGRHVHLLRSGGRSVGEHTTFDSALTALRRALNDLLNGTAGPVRAL